MASSFEDKLKSSGILAKLNHNCRKYASIQESKSLLVIYDQELFVWHDAGSCMLTVEMKHSDLNAKAACKVLMPTNPPVFEVECLLFNRIGSLLALIGHKGIMVVEIPWRYGKFRAAAETNANIFCRSWHIAERFFICSSRVSILQVAWYPGSSTSSHLAVLSSDNYLRLYDVTDSQIPLQVFLLGPSSKSSYISTEAKISFSTCLGENAVSFDFGPPENVLPKASAKKEVTIIDEEPIYPVFILHGNGDIYVVKMSLKKKSYRTPKVEGPLAMYPPAEDNYGVDACSLLCLHSTPLVLVIATGSGMLYHCLLLDSSNSDEDIKFNDLSCSYGSSECDIALYVYESVELPLSLTSEEPEDAYCQSIRLYKDVSSYSRYHCTHVTGVHSVAMPFIHQIEECNEKDDLEAWLSQLQENNCVVEHLLSTRPLSAVEAVPVIGLGMAVGDKGVIMISLLASWEFVCLPLVSSFHSSAPNLLSSDLSTSENDSNQLHKEIFEQHIEHFLHRSTCTPLLKSSMAANNTKTASKQWLELLTSVTQRFREEYVQRLNAVQAQVDSRMKILVQHKEQQIIEVKRCLREKEELRNGAERLAEKYEDACSNQQVFSERIEKVLQMLQKRLPVVSSAEVNMKQSLLELEEKLKAFQISYAQIKERQSFQSQKIKQYQSRSNTELVIRKKLENMNLSATQLKHVKEILMQEGKSIVELMKTVEELKKETSV